MRTRDEPDEADAMMRFLASVFVLSTCATLARADVPPTAMHAAAFARVHHPITTTSSEAQAYFDQGLTLLYSFNRGAARHAFEHAAKADPSSAMAQWGIAMALGPNINVDIDAAGEKNAYAAVQRGLALTSHATPRERDYLRAAATRYSNAAKIDRPALGRAYQAAMARLASRYPDDLDAATLYAEAWMDLRPWALYTPTGQPVEGTAQIVQILESVMRRDPQHIGANHYYIHTLEASRHPEVALVSAARLGAMNFEAAAAHLVHMPAHIYMRTGDFDAAAASNEQATAHDRMFLHAEHDPEASGYYGHNLTMLTTGYAMQGRFADAKRTADVLVSQGSYVQELFVLMRFARWNDILALAQPRTDVDGPIVIPLWHFARGLAYAGSGDADGAQRERQALGTVATTTHVPGLAGVSNSSHDLSALADAVLAGRIAQLQHDDAGAVAAFDRATRMYDAFLYIEPPDWYAPPREAFGGALLRAGRYAEAEQVFRDDLARNQRNPRSLFGLAAALRGQGRTDDAALVDEQFQAAWHRADTKLTVADL